MPNENINPMTMEQVTIHDFSQGIVSDQSPLVSTPGTLRECINFEVEEDGSIRRRRGIQFEPAVTAAVSSTAEWDKAEDAQFFYWRNVGNLSGKNIVVVYFRGEVLFFDPTGRYWGEGYFEGQDLTLPEFQETPAVQGLFEPDRSEAQVSISSADGDLFIASSVVPTMYHIRWDNNTDTVKWKKKFRITVNDFFEYNDLNVTGEEDDAPRDYYRKPFSAISDALKARDVYANLNRGWKFEQIDSWLTYVNTEYEESAPPVNVYPFYFKVENNLDFSNEVELALGSRSIPGGSLVIDLFNRGGTASVDFGGDEPAFLETLPGDVVATRQKKINRIISELNLTVTAEDAFNLSKDITFGGIKDLEYALGRMWYICNDAGQVDGTDELNDPNVENRLTNRPPISSMVLFSQALQDPEFAGRCHSTFDPTSEVAPGPTISDGGYIIITDMARPQKILSFLDGILVFAVNGVWYVRGGSNGFTPQEYFVDRIATEGPVSRDAIVQVGNMVMYFGEHEIHQISLGQDGSGPQAGSLSRGVINKKFRDIPRDNLRYANGTYDALNNRVIWQYTDKDFSDQPEVNYILYNRELVLDLELGAFFENSITTDQGSFQDFGSSSNIVSKAIYDRSGEVPQRRLSIKYPCLLRTQEGGIEISFAEKTNDDFVDFPGLDGDDAKAELVTNPLAPTRGLTQIQAPHLLVHSRFVEDGYRPIEPDWFSPDLEFVVGLNSTQNPAIKFSRNWETDYEWILRDVSPGIAMRGGEVVDDTTFVIGSRIQKVTEEGEPEGDSVLVAPPQNLRDFVMLHSPVEKEFRIAYLRTGAVTPANTEVAAFTESLESSTNLVVEDSSPGYGIGLSVTGKMYWTSHDGDDNNKLYISEFPDGEPEVHELNIQGLGVTTDLYTDDVNGVLVIVSENRLVVLSMESFDEVINYEWPEDIGTVNASVYTGDSLYVTGARIARYSMTEQRILLSTPSPSFNSNHDPEKSLGITNTDDLFFCRDGEIYLYDNRLRLRASANWDSFSIPDSDFAPSVQPYIGVKNSYVYGAYRPNGLGEPVSDDALEINNPGSVKVRTRWDFTNNVKSGKISPEFQAYRHIRPSYQQANDEFNYGYDLIVTNTKIHGRGRAVQMNMYTEPGKDFHVYSWSLMFDPNGGV